MAWRIQSVLAVAVMVLGLGGCSTARRAVLTADLAVLTQHNDNQRTGAYLSETVLTPKAVDPSTGPGMGTRYRRPLDGSSIHAQVLYVPRLNFGSQTLDVVFAFAMNNTAYAYDLNEERNSGTTQGLIWKRTLPATPSPTLPTPLGIQGTPVIDLDTQTVYLVYGISNGLFPLGGQGDGGIPCGDLIPCGDPGDPVDGRYEVEYHLAALDILTGTLWRDVVISGSVSSTVAPFYVDFVARRHNQRAGLLLTDNPFDAQERTVYVAFATRHNEATLNYHGWVFGYDAATFAPRGVFCSTPDRTAIGEGGGIWQGSAGIAADGAGSLYFSTGNGPGSGNPSMGNNHGNSFVKLTPVLSSNTYSFNVSAFDAAADDDPKRASDWQNNDIDLGSGGVTVIPGSSQLAGGGKTGVMYLMDRTTMAKVQSFEAFTNTYDSTQRYNHYMTGPHMHGAPTYWQVSSNLGYLYHWGEKDYLKRFDHNRTTWQLHAIATLLGDVVAEPTLMPGGLISLSANGTTDGVLWITLPGPSPDGRVFANDAVTLRRLWKTTECGGVNHFNPPTIAEGRVIVGVSNGFVVYGLNPNRLAGAVGRPAALPSPPDPEPRIRWFIKSLTTESAATLAPSREHRPIFLALGKGTLTYEARRADDGALQWALVGMSDSLTDQSGVMPNMGRQGLGHVVATAGPGLSLMAHDGGHANLTLAASVPAPTPTDAPWVLFRAAPGREPGLLDGVTYVQRLGTTGGAPPPIVHEAGSRVDVPYEAVYAFYYAEKKLP